MDVILLGIQGAGKGTQGEKLLQTGKYATFSVGELLREKAKTSEEIAFFLSSGKLVPDETVFSIMREFMQNKKESGDDRPFIFDGIPRTISQYHRFIAMLESMDRQYVSVYFEITLQTALERLRGRRVCGTCKKPSFDAEARFCGYCASPLIIREDDKNIDSVLQRFSIFYQETFPVILEVIRSENVIFMDADRDRDDIFFELKNRLDTHTFSRFNVF